MNDDEVARSWTEWLNTTFREKY